MASIAEVVEGLQILMNTSRIPRGLAETGVTDRSTAHITGAEPDIIFGPVAEPTPDDIHRLKCLGWHFDDDAEVWSIFV